MPVSKRRTKGRDQRNPKYNKNATPYIYRFNTETGEYIEPIRITNKIKYTPENDGHNNPARMRAAATKAFHARKNVIAA